MVKPVMRENVDESTSHSDPSYEVAPGASWSGSKAKKGASTVFVNGKPIMRKNDPYYPHVGYKHVLSGDPPEPTKVDDQHSDVVAGEGSLTVFAEQQPVHLETQKVSCGQGGGSKATGGSPDVFAAE
jgi:uncharacterized Zn-binding protein involved in type VI secretion